MVARLDERTGADQAAAAPARRNDGGRSRVTAVARILLSLWLVGNGVATIASPLAVAESTGTPAGLLLRLAAGQFTLGIFLLSGFMSRVCGLLLAILGAYTGASLGWNATALLYVLFGLYLVLRGGGTWGMDVYVQKMQNRVRERERREAAEAARAEEQ